MREPVKWFANQMEKRLNENDFKGGWDQSTFSYLIDRLQQEVDELRQVLMDGGVFAQPGRVAHEAADVANFAMMLADNYRRYHEHD